MTYDVTAVSHDGHHIALTAETTYSMAHDIARPRSADTAWKSVQVREAGTSKVIAAYAGGVITEGTR